MRLRPLLTTLVIALLTVVATGAARPPERDAEARRLAAAIDAFAKPLVERGDLSGQLLVARGDRILVERFYGFADWELRTPVTPETRFCIASVTKPITGSIAIQLMSEGRIGYRDSIARWLPDFPRGNRITIEHLLRHRSGIPHELLPDSEATRAMSTAGVTALASRKPLDFEPGTKGNYSSGGFSVLTRILELASGRTYAELLQERVFGPLGMTHSADHDGRTLLPGRARAVVPGARGLQNAAYEDFSHIVGAGSVWSTARDLHLFVRGLVSGRLGPGPRASYVRDGKLDFNGIAGGFRAFCDWDSTTDLEVIFTGNLHTGAPDALRGAIANLAAGRPAPPPSLPSRVTTAVPEAELRRCEGTYQLGNGTRLVVRTRDGVLWVNDWVLLPAANGGWFSPRDYGRVQAVAGADGSITRLDWEQRGEVYPAPRVDDVAR